MLENRDLYESHSNDSRQSRPLTCQVFKKAELSLCVPHFTLRTSVKHQIS